MEMLGQRSSARRSMLKAGMPALLCLAAALQAGCSLLVEGTPKGCQSDAECVSFPGTVCSEGMCSAQIDACSAHVDCKGAGEFSICSKESPRKCISLTNEQCASVDGDWQSEDAILLGLLSPLSGDNASTGKSIQNGARLAVADLNIQGLPPVPDGQTRRPLALVSCDDRADRSTALVAANHLIDNLGVDAIIGPAFSGITLHVANQATIQKGVLLLSPSATSKLLTHAEDRDPTCIAGCGADSTCTAGCPGLLWRTSPADTIQAAALAGYFASSYEAEVRADLENPPFMGTLRVAVAFKGDAYGASLKEELEQQLVFNGALALQQLDPEAYRAFDYGNPDDPNEVTRYTETVQALVSLAPHVVFVFGTDEGVTQIFSAVEATWTAAQKPHWVFSDGGLLNALSAGAKDKSAAPRIRGTVPGTNNANFLAFMSQYNSQFIGELVGGPQVFGAAGAYDAVYLLAYSAVAARAPVVDGATLARGFASLVSGSQVKVGKGNINTALVALTSGGSIDFDGASGPLDFDLATGEARSDIQIWCLPKPDALGNVGLGMASGVEYANGVIQGSLKTSCAGR